MCVGVCVYMCMCLCVEGFPAVHTLKLEDTAQYMVDKHNDTMITAAWNKLSRLWA